MIAPRIFRRSNISGSGRLIWSIPLIFLMLTHISTAHAGDSAYNGTIEKEEQRLNEVRRKLRECRQEGDRLVEEERGFLERLDRLDRERELGNRLINGLTAKERVLQEEIDSVSADLSYVQKELAHRSEVLSRRLREIFKHGRIHPLEVWLTAPSFSSAVKRMRYLELSAVADRRMVDRVSSLVDTLTLQKGRLDSTLIELELTRREAEAERAQLAKKEKQQKALLTVIRERKQEQLLLASELEKSARDLEDLIKELERKRRDALALSTRPEPVGKPDFDAAQGKLPWPTGGKVVSQFGLATDPTYGTKTRNNGIDISAPYGSPVHSVASGNVVYSGRFLGYGNVVLMEHGNGYYTLYGHLSESLVTVDEQVASGRRIGSVGDSGSLVGALLHFELRKGAVPLDPLKWLSTR